jgi:hypothetical protein
MSPFQAYKKYCNGRNTRNNVFNNNTFPSDDDDDDDDDAAELSQMEAGETVQSGGEGQQPVVHNETAVKAIQALKIVPYKVFLIN